VLAAGVELQGPVAGEERSSGLVILPIPRLRGLVKLDPLHERLVTLTRVDGDRLVRSSK
jgi:hypothetical protein